MGVTFDDLDGTPSSPDIDHLSIATSTDTQTPTTQSGATSPTNELEEDAVLTSQKKKKKKKKTKRSPKAKEAATQAKAQQESNGKPPVLCISRNKHWRYISSYHGPWLQLPLELLESLLVLNLDPTTLAAASPDPGQRLSLPPPPVPSISVFASKQRERGYLTLNDSSPPQSPHNLYNSLTPLHSHPLPCPGKAIPPPIDPGAFKSVTSIRRLIEEAAELSVRATSGLSAAERGPSRGASGLNNPWGAAASLGINPLGGGNNNGRNVAMSAMRIHRLRALAVQKLAQAYKADEIASSVMVMQGGSVFDDVAERVLHHDPTDLDAKYVHFFHEKIPSRQLAESTSTRVLDELIAARPQHLEYYRTRGIVHCFRDEYSQATKDFTYALKEARAVRKAKTLHRNLNLLGEARPTKNGKRKKAGAGLYTNGQAPPDGTSALGSDNVMDGLDGEPLLLHPSVLPEAPEPIEGQLLFLRGAAYLQHAVFLIEAAILKLEEVEKGQFIDGAELRLCHLEHGRYGGIEIGNPDGPLGKSDGAKLAAYREILAAEPFREQITVLLRKSIRDHEKFLSHFDSLESPNALHGGDLAHQAEYAFLVAESHRPGSHTGSTTAPHPRTFGHSHSSISGLTTPSIYTTYHPLLVESHFSILLAQLMLADFIELLPNFTRTAALVDGLDGYPVFLPPRSMGQAEFMEVLERLAGGWGHGVKPHSLVGVQRRIGMASGTGKGRMLAIEGPPPMVDEPPDGALMVTRYSSKFSMFDANGSSSSASSSRKNSSVNEECSSSSGFAASGSSSSSSSIPPAPPTPPPPPPPSTASSSFNSHAPWPPADGAKTLDYARILLAPVAKRQRLLAEKAEKAKAKAAREKAKASVVEGLKANGSGDGAKKKPSTISIPLHGPRVEIVLAWLGAVHLPELEGYP